MALVKRADLGVVRPERGPAVVSPAHDVLTSDEWHQILSSEPDSFLHVTAGSDDDPSRGQAAAQRLLDSDAYEFCSDSLFVYEMSRGDHRQLGLVGLVSVEAYASGQLKPHEQVRPVAIDRMVKHLGILGVEGSPIVAAHPDIPEVAAHLEAVAAGPPVVEIDRGFGNRHRAWVLSDADRLAEIEMLLADADAYVIDGHHRAAAAAIAQDKEASADGEWLLGALFPLSGLASRSYHRRIKTSADPATMATQFETQLIDDPHTIEDRSSVAVRLGGAWWSVNLGDLPLAESSPLDVLDPVRADTLLGPVLGSSAETVRYISDREFSPNLVAEVDAAGDALVLCRPVTADDVVRVADAGAFMPPKSSYFVPKSAEGLFLRTRSRS